MTYRSNIKLEFAKYAAELYFSGLSAKEAIEKAKEVYYGLPEKLR